MTSQADTEDPRFRRLVRTRSLFAISFTLVNLASYMAFQLCVSFAPDFLATPVWGRLSMTVGILWGTAQVLLAIVLIAAYLLIANTRLDKLEKAARQGNDGAD